MSWQTDRDLWSDAAGGDGDAFGVLFDRHVQAVYRHCFWLTSSWTGAEDATQSAFLVAWRKRGEVRLVDDSILPWLLSVSGNVVRDQQRSLRRWRNAVLRLPPEPDGGDFADEVAGRVDSQRRMRELLGAVRRLPRAERAALALCVWSRVAYADAAVVLGVNEAAVRARVSRARRRLIRLLGPGDDPSPAVNPLKEARVTGPEQLPPAYGLPADAQRRMRERLLAEISGAKATARSRRRAWRAPVAVAASVLLAAGGFTAIRTLAGSPSSAPGGAAGPTGAVGGVDCGTYVVVQGEQLPQAAVRCLTGAAAAGEPARLQQTRPSVEGDSIVTTYAAPRLGSCHQPQSY